MKESQVITALGALAHQSRLRVIRLLITAGEDGMAAGAIGESIKAAPSKVSFHLSVLQQAGLVKTRRVSRSIVYRANFTVIGRVMNYMLVDCCSADSRVLSCCGFGKKMGSNE